MITRRALLQQAAALALAAPLATTPALHPAFAETGPEAGLAAMPADSFVEFISVQTHLNRRDSIWEQTTWRPLLGDLGVRYTRSALGNVMARDHLAALYNEYRIRSSATFSQTNEDGTFKLDVTRKKLALLRDEVGAEMLYAIEGPNEYTHKFKTEGWAERLRGYQEFLYNTVKSDTELGQLAVLAPSIFKRVVADYEAIGDISAHADYGNLHLYNGGRRPSQFNRDETDAPIDIAIEEARIVTPGKQICITETGFSVTEGTAPTKWVIPPDVAAKYTLRMLAEFFLRRDRVKRVNIYSLIDDEHRDIHHGLLDADLNPRPAYHALRNLIGLLADPGPEFEPATLACKIEGGGEDLRWLVLQKRDKRFLLMLWQDATSYDRQAAAAVEIAPRPVTVDFGRSVASLKLYTPTVSNTVTVEHSAVSSIKVNVPDHLMLVEIAL